MLIPTTYILISLLLTLISVNTDQDAENTIGAVFLNTNGVHLDVVIPVAFVEPELLRGLQLDSRDSYLSFGWGDENFYLNTPEWSDLTFSTAFKAAFLKSPTLMHITRYTRVQSDWVLVLVNSRQLQKLNAYLLNSFALDSNGSKIWLEGQGYNSRDDFYKAKGNYSCFNTCNSWVNTAFKESDLKAALWTPFDWGLMNKYER